MLASTVILCNTGGPDGAGPDFLLCFQNCTSRLPFLQCCYIILHPCGIYYLIKDLVFLTPDPTNFRPINPKHELFLGALTGAGGRIRPLLLLCFFVPLGSTPFNTRGGMIISYSVHDRISHVL